LRTHVNTRAVCRIIDANVNRAKEGLRVCEEIARFILEDRSLTAGFKNVRHGIDGIVAGMHPYAGLVLSRNSAGDVGRRVHTAREFSRKDFRDILFANMQRVKESVRVLEEFSKLQDVSAAGAFKQLRYRMYEVEKKAAARLL
jgi:thiamine-phosphate pyrophosphorylase